MKIAICTNIPDKNSPMLLSYFNYCTSDGHKAYIIGKKDIYNKVYEGSIFTTNYLQYKLHYLLVPFVAIFLIFWTIGLFFNLKKRKPLPLSTTIKDFASATKYFANTLYLNLFHFITLLRIKPDFVVCVCAGSTIAARGYQFFTNTPFSYNMYEIYPNQLATNSIISKHLKATIESKACKKASTIFIPFSNQYKRLLCLRYKLNTSTKFVQICSIPKDIEPPTLPTESKSYVSIYYHGSYDKQRGLETLVYAIKNFSANKVKLYLRGFGSEEAFLKQIVQQESLSHQIVFLEPLPPDQLASAAAGYDVGITMIKNETANNRFLIGFKAIDFIAAGIVLIVPDGYVLKDLVEKYKVGIHYDTLTVESLTRTIKKIVDNPAAFQNYKENSKKLANDVINFNAQKKIFLQTIDTEIKENRYFNTITY